MLKGSLEGSRYGRLTVEELYDFPKPGKPRWVCKCDCGAKNIIVYGYNLKNGNTASCGCLKIEATKLANSTHGKSRTREYNVYCTILARCYSRTNQRYKWYGKRGITVARRWLGKGGFENFLVDMGPKPTSKHSIERIDNDGPYCPSNCRWATQKEQSRNKRTNRVIEIAGRKMCLKQLCEELDIPYSRTAWRLKAGWDIERVIGPRDARMVKK